MYWGHPSDNFRKNIKTIVYYRVTDYDKYNYSLDSKRKVQKLNNVLHNIDPNLNF